MVHNQLHAIDLIIIAAYLISMVLIGVVVVKKVQSMDDYYLGGRSFGPLVLMATVCATIMGGRGLFQRLQGHYDGTALSSGYVYFLWLCRADLRSGHYVPCDLNPGPF